jgi:transcriptional regulator with XRE-family HTH domain
VGDRLEAARSAARLTQPQVAAAIGVKQQQVSAWERGARIPDRHRAPLAEALGIPLTELLTWIAEDSELRHAATRRELTEMTGANERLVGEVERLHQAMEQMMRLQDEILRLLREPNGPKRRTG